MRKLAIIVAAIAALLVPASAGAVQARLYHVEPSVPAPGAAKGVRTLIETHTGWNNPGLGGVYVSLVRIEGAGSEGVAGLMAAGWIESNGPVVVDIGDGTWGGDPDTPCITQGTVVRGLYMEYRHQGIANPYMCRYIPEAQLPGVTEFGYGVFVIRNLTPSSGICGLACGWVVLVDGNCLLPSGFCDQLGVGLGFDAGYGVLVSEDTDGAPTPGDLFTAFGPWPAQAGWGNFQVQQGPAPGGTWHTVTAVNQVLIPQPYPGNVCWWQNQVISTENPFSRLWQVRWQNEYPNLCPH